MRRPGKFCKSSTVERRPTTHMEVLVPRVHGCTGAAFHPYRTQPCNYLQAKKKPLTLIASRALNKSLAVSYFHMGKPHTIIGAKAFHFRVRDGIGWYHLAMATRQTVITFGEYRVACYGQRGLSSHLLPTTRYLNAKDEYSGSNVRA